jgi:succinate dehydrogenase / fumarate reductase, flavoprotein subunit
MIWNSDLAEAMEYDNLLSQAMVTLYSAAKRTESRLPQAPHALPRPTKVAYNVRLRTK